MRYLYLIGLGIGWLVAFGGSECSANVDDPLARQYYEMRIRPVLLKSGMCNRVESIPLRIEIVDSPSVQAGSFIRQIDPGKLEFEPHIGLHRGLLEFAAAIAYYHSAGRPMPGAPLSRLCI